MKQKALIVFLFAALTPWIAELLRAEVKPLELTQADCIKCHFAVVKAMADQPSAHKAELACMDCHEGHPPNDRAVIPKCSQCHAPGDSRHFTSANCTACHDPHAPQVVSFGKMEEVKPVCLTCHADTGEQMKQLPSAHSEQDCASCHHAHGLGKGESDTCLDCHERHAPNLQLQDCLACHLPHQPTSYIWKGPVKNELCGACHDDILKDFNLHGAAHAGKLTCTKCHEAHPPREKNVIPSCSKCHAPGEKRHYAQKECTGCHNPHSPKNIDFSRLKSVRTMCIACHGDAGDTMERYPTAHAELECNECHIVHRKHQSCLECHEGHSEEMKYADCLKCHVPHHPVPPAIAKSVSSRLCGSCHKKECREQASDKSRHAGLQCVYCHGTRHKVILKCRTCHGDPHDAALHRRYPDCRKCHKDPHHLMGGK